MKRLICFFFGHRSIKGLFEDDEIITDRGCSRCEAMFMTSRSVWKGLRDCPPPYGSAESYQRCCDEKEAEARREFASQ